MIGRPLGHAGHAGHAAAVGRAAELERLPERRVDVRFVFDERPVEGAGAGLQIRHVERDPGMCRRWSAWVYVSMSETPTHPDEREADEHEADEPASDPDAPGTYVDDDTSPDIPEPNEPG